MAVHDRVNDPTLCGIIVGPTRCTKDGRKLANAPRMSACCSSPCTASLSVCASTGRATVNYDDPLLAEIVGAQLIVRVTARAIFPNCPRYIPTMLLVEPSPTRGHIVISPHGGLYAMPSLCGSA